MLRRLSLVGLLSTGCAGTAVSLEELVAVSQPDTPVDTGGLSVGGYVGMLPWRACPVEVYRAGKSIGGGGAAANDVFAKGVVSRLSVTGLLVDVDRPEMLIADVSDERGEAHRLAIKTGEKTECLIGWSEGLERLHGILGTMVSFKPNADACSALALRGDDVRKVVDGSGGERSYQVTAITVSERGGEAVPWLRVGGMEVRHDVLATCFGPADATDGVLDASSATPERSFEKIAGAYPGTCHPSRDGGVECVSSVAVWQGKLRDNVVDLRRVRRTLGAVLMRDGTLASAPMNERVIVNIPEVRNQRIATVRQGATAAVGELVLHPIAGVAIADASQGNGDLRVDVELRDLVLGRMTTGKLPASSEYILRYEDKWNPAYDVASNAVTKARSDREIANSQYQSAMVEYENTKKACAAAADQAKKMMGGGFAASLISAAGEAGCDIALAPSNEALIQAEVALSTAESTLSTTPRTVQSPVMAPWNYEKTTYRRTVGVKLLLKLTDTKSGMTETRTVQVDHVWEDFTAMRDDVHNVEGKEIPQALLADADGLLPELAVKVEATLRAVLAQRVVELGMVPARAALSSSFGSTMGEQLIDSSAFLVARERLRASLARGEVSATAGKAVTAQVGSLSLQPNQCVMVVALPSDMSRHVRLATRGGAVADQRGVVPAYFEVCGSTSGLEQIEITSDGDGPVRWAAYATTLFETTIAASQAP